VVKTLTFALNVDVDVDVDRGDREAFTTRPQRLYISHLCTLEDPLGVARLEPQGPLAKQTGFRTKALARAHSRPDRRLAAYVG
jgi:hypothetical protein